MLVGKIKLSLLFWKWLCRFVLEYKFLVIKHKWARVMDYIKWFSTAHPLIYRIVKFNIILAIKLSGGALSFIGLLKGCIW